MFSAGVDIISIPRIQKSMRNAAFVSRVLGGRERERLEKKGFPAQGVAAAFAAKEAFAKCVGTGLSGFSLKDVELLTDEKGKPYYAFSGKAAQLVKELGVSFTVSVSHEGTIACVFALAYPAAAVDKGREPLP